MGRRELLIALAFVVVGLLAYHWTVPAGAPSDTRVSLGDRLASIRREIRGNPGRGSFTHHGVVAVPHAVTEVRLTGVGPLTLIGEARTDIAYELTVQSTGNDDAAARATAAASTVAHDAYGHVLALRVTHPPQARSTSTLAVRVPSRVAIRIESIRRATIAEVDAVHLENVVGDIQLKAVAGAVSGSHRNGAITVTGAGSVALTVTGSRATLTAVGGSVHLTGRGGELHVADPGGAVEVTGTDLNLVIARPRGAVRVSGSNGQVAIDRPRATTDIDGRRLEITVTLDAAVPVTAATTERPLRVVFDGAPAVTIDAVASDGATIDATALDLTAEPIERGQRLLHRVGGDTRVALRNQRGAIVIGRTK
jgi:hypothetical protein